MLAQTAVIQEGLRISAIVTTRLPRIAPDEVLKYGKHEIPTNVSFRIHRVFQHNNSSFQTPVSMTSHFIHLDPTVWPEPMKFIPERWIDGAVGVPKGQKKYLVPFSKGSRGCLGIK